MGLAGHPGTDQPAGLQTLFADAFMAAVTPAYGHTWAAVIDRFSADPGEWDTVTELRTAIRDHGLRRPVWVTVDEGTGVLTVGNGMHRVIAAYLEGTDVPYTVADTPPPTHGDVRLSVEFRLTFPATAGARHEDSLFDDVHAWLRSFPLDGDAWADCDAFSSHGAGRDYHAYYTVTKHAADQFPAVLAHRAGALPGSPTLTMTVLERAGE